MPQFSYRARNAQGGLVEGVLNVADRSVAIRQIEQQQCIPIRIEAIAAARKWSTDSAGAGRCAPTQNLKVPHSQLLVFTEQLGHLLQAGMTLDESLGVLEKRLKHPRVQQMTSALHQALVDGRSFSQALRDFPRIFPPLYVNMVGAGEASGALPDILTRVVQHLMQAKNLRDRVQQALIYPAFLAFAGSALITIFITFMVPQLTKFMSQTGGTLPLPTRILLGDQSRHHRLLVGLCPARRSAAMVAFALLSGAKKAGSPGTDCASSFPATADSPAPVLRAIFAHSGHVDGKWNSAAQGPGSGHGNRGEQISRERNCARCGAR